MGCGPKKPLCVAASESPQERMGCALGACGCGVADVSEMGHARRKTSFPPCRRTTQRRSWRARGQTENKAANTRRLTFSSPQEPREGRTLLSDWPKYYHERLKESLPDALAYLRQTRQSTTPKPSSISKSGLATERLDSLPTNRTNAGQDLRSRNGSCGVIEGKPGARTDAALHHVPRIFRRKAVSENLRGAVRTTAASRN